MSDSLTDLLATDAELDLIAARLPGATSDLVLMELANLAAFVDEAPLPAAVVIPRPAAMSKAHKGGWALSVTVALMVATSGVAAAVSDSPLAPLHYVTNQVWKIGPHNDGKLPGWEINGSMPISTVGGAAVGGSSKSGQPTTSVGTTTSGSNAGGAPPGGPGMVTGHGGDPGTGTGYGSHPAGGSSGQGVRAGPPPGGSGHQPGSNTPPGSGAGNPGGPSGPGRPTKPGNPVGKPAHEGGHGGTTPGAGRVPGSATGHCHFQHSPTPGASTSSGGGHAGRHSCGLHHSAPPRTGVPASPPSGATSQTPATSEPRRSLP